MTACTHIVECLSFSCAQTPIPTKPFSFCSAEARRHTPEPCMSSDFPRGPRRIQHHDFPGFHVQGPTWARLGVNALTREFRPSPKALMAILMDKFHTTRGRPSLDWTAGAHRPSRRPPSTQRRAPDPNRPDREHVLSFLPSIRMLTVEASMGKYCPARTLNIISPAATSNPEKAFSLSRSLSEQISPPSCSSSTPEYRAY